MLVERIIENPHFIVPEWRVVEDRKKLHTYICTATGCLSSLIRCYVPVCHTIRSKTYYISIYIDFSLKRNRSDHILLILLLSVYGRYYYVDWRDYGQENTNMNRYI